MLTAQVLAMMRRITESFLTQTCTIEVESNTRGSMGEPLHQWAIVASDVPCRVITAGRQTGSNIEQAGSAEGLMQEYRLVVGRSTSLTVDMRITVDDVQYQVVRLETALTDEAFHAAIVQRR